MYRKLASVDWYVIASLFHIEKNNPDKKFPQQANQKKKFHKTKNRYLGLINKEGISVINRKKTKYTRFSIIIQKYQINDDNININQFF